MSLLRMRLTDRKISQGVIEWTAVADDADLLLSAAPGGGSSVGSDVAVTARTAIEVLDIPMLANADDDTGVYVKLGPLGSPWNGGQAFAKLPASYRNLGMVKTPSMIGIAMSVLPDYAGILSFDESSYVDVYVRTGVPLVSVTPQEALAGKNAFLIGSEIIVACNALLLSPDNYRLSRLLRYQRGTEDAAGTHRSGERVVALEIAGMLRVDEGADQIGVSKTYVGVSVGRTVDALDAQTFTNTARGIRPFAPINLRSGFIGNDVVMNWTRRTRFFAPFGPEAPLGEPTELYDLQISADPSFASPQVTLPAGIIRNADGSVNAKFGLFKPSFRFLPADQVNWLGTLTTFYWRVAQASDRLTTTISNGSAPPLSRSDARDLSIWSAANRVDLPAAAVMPVLATVLQINTTLPDGTTTFTDSSSYAAPVVVYGAVTPPVINANAIVIFGSGNPAGTSLSISNDAAFNWRERDFAITFRFKREFMLSRSASGYGPGSWVLKWSMGRGGFWAADHAPGLSDLEALTIFDTTEMSFDSSIEHSVRLERRGSTFSLYFPGLVESSGSGRSGGFPGMMKDFAFTDCSAPILIGSDGTSSMDGDIADILIQRA